MESPITLKDIKLGNYFKTRTGIVFKVDEIEKKENNIVILRQKSIFDDEPGISEELSFLKPIAITDDFLKNLGFEKTTSLSRVIYGLKVLNSKTLNFEKYGYVLEEEKLIFRANIRVDLRIRFVHELQNLIYNE